jgi:hypothetical protein
MRGAALFAFAFVVAFGAAGCALVSGLSGLDVGGNDAAVAFDASVDVKPKLDAAPPDGAADGATDAVAPPPIDAAADVTDVGPCAVSGPDPAPIQTSCVTGKPIFAAGTIPSGTYSLVILREFASSCGGFNPVPASGLLKITALGGSAYTLQERVTVNGVVTQRYYDATVSGTTMTVSLKCGPPILSKLWELNVSVVGGKTQFVAYQQGSPNDLRYFWLEQ